MVYNGYDPTKEFDPKPTKNNDIVNRPVLVYYHKIELEPNLHGMYINQRLADLQFNKVLSPSQTYQEIYNWISEHKPEASIPDSPDDMSRYEAKGFDEKKSFRHRK